MEQLSSAKGSGHDPSALFSVLAYCEQSYPPISIVVSFSEHRSLRLVVVTVVVGEVTVVGVVVGVEVSEVVVVADVVRVVVADKVNVDVTDVVVVVAVVVGVVVTVQSWNCPMLYDSATSFSV